MDMGKKGGRPDNRPSKIIDLNEFRAKRGYNTISREECLNLLRRIGTISDKDAGLLNIPEKVYLIEGPAGSMPSISSDPEKGAAKVAGCILMDLPLPPDQPDFGIHFTSRGSSLYCTIVDKKRKVVVSEVISDGYTRRVDWGDFIYSLQDAVVGAEEKSMSGEKFDFVVVKESIPKTA
jgi:hypothetical protein